MRRMLPCGNQKRIRGDLHFTTQMWFRQAVAPGSGDFRALAGVCLPELAGAAFQGLTRPWSRNRTLRVIMKTEPDKLQGKGA
jgi:hypothetical protein